MKLSLPQDKTILLAGIVVTISALILLGRTYIYPTPPGNSALYFPAAVNFASNRGLVNEVSHVIPQIDKTGESRYISYPPLFPIIISLIMPATNSWGVFLSIAMIEIIIVAMSAWLLRAVIKATGDNFGWFNLLLASFALLAILAPFQYNSTRTEIMFHFFTVILSGIIFLYYNSRYLWLIFGIVLGISGAIHPIHTIFLSLLMGLFFAVRTSAKPAMLAILKVGVVSSVVFLFLMAITPYNILDKISGVLAHTRLYGGGQWFWHASRGAAAISPAIYLEQLFRYFILSPSSFFWGPFLILLLILAFRFYKNNKAAIKSPLLFYLFLLLFLIMLGSAVARPDSIYYFTMFSSLFFAGAIYAALSERRAAWKWILIATFAFMSISSLRILALMPFYFKSGVTITEARRLYKELNLPACAGCVGITPASLWVLSENYEAMTTELEADRAGKSFGEEVNVILFAQQSTGLTNPPQEYAGCNLKKDHFVKEVPKILGVKLGNTMPGYGFAVYQCASK